jgi:hypothetical protein
LRMPATVRSVISPDAASKRAVTTASLTSQSPRFLASYA